VLKGVAEGGHEDANVTRAGAADVETWEIEGCFWVDDAVPGLVGQDSAWAGTGARWRPCHLVEHFEAVVLLFDHLGPGETGPRVRESAAGFLVWGFGEAWDEEVSEARVCDLLHTGRANV